MNDENKNNPDENEDFEDFDDAFEDDFGLEEINEAQETSEHDESSKDESVVERPAPKKTSALPYLIGLAVIGFFGWKLYGMLFKPSAPPPEEQIVAIAKPEVMPVTKTVVEPVVIEQPISIPEPSKPLPPSATEQELQQVQTDISAQNKLYQQKIEALEKEIAQTKESVDNSSRLLNNMNQDLSHLGAAMQELSAQIDSLREYQEREVLRHELTKKSAVKKPKQTQSADKSASLSVYAIIPGRAWLRSPNGKTITVTEGDSIAEFGKVLKIDASNGVVITTSGVTLR